jgi:hypothetical protein
VQSDSEVSTITSLGDSETNLAAAEAATATETATTQSQTPATVAGTKAAATKTPSVPKRYDARKQAEVERRESAISLYI